MGESIKVVRSRSGQIEYPFLIMTVSQKPVLWTEREDLSTKNRKTFIRG